MVVLETFVIVFLCFVGYALSIALYVKVSEYFGKRKNKKQKRENKEREMN